MGAGGWRWPGNPRALRQSSENIRESAEEGFQPHPLDEAAQVSCSPDEGHGEAGGEEALERVRRKEGDSFVEHEQDCQRKYGDRGPEDDEVDDLRGRGIPASAWRAWRAR